MARVSVLIPTYNRAALLPQAIASVLAQTYRDLDVLVIDDGSTDETPELLKAFADPRLRYLRLEHRGVSAALDAGWRAVESEYVARLDSDDVWRPELLAQLMPLIESDPGVAFAYARAQLMDADGNLLPQLFGAPPKYPEDSLASLLYGDCVCSMAVVIRRAAIARAGGYDTSLVGNEDWDLWLRLAEHDEFAFCDRVLAHYRVHAQNLTQARADQNPRLIQDRLRVLDKFYSRPDVSARALDLKPIAYRNLYQDIAVRHLAAHRRRQALVFFMRSLRVAPDPLTACFRGTRTVLYQLGLGRTRAGVRLAALWQARHRR